jgi:3-methylfumaryl-CoA hydratase
MFDIHTFSVHGKVHEDGRRVHLWARDHEGWLAMDATATVKNTSINDIAHGLVIS